MPLGSITVLYHCLHHRGAAGGQPHAPVQAARIPFWLGGQRALPHEPPVRAVLDAVGAVANPADHSSFQALLAQQEEACPLGTLGLLRQRQVAAKLAGRAASLLDCAE